MRGRSSSPVTSKLTRMALRKQVVKDGGGVPSGSQKLNENTQENEAVDVLSDQDGLSPSLTLTRQKHRRERETKSKPAEMTEKQMIDLALRLSEQEASVAALRLQQEEDTMKKAIQDSIVGQTQQCSPSQSKHLLPAAASLRLSSRRKLLYSEGKRTSAVDQGASGDVCQTETHLSQERNKDGDKKENRNKKRKRTHGSPLLEMPDLSQTQKICSQASDSLSEPLDSQSSDSTQNDDCQLRKSPVFPLTGCRAEVHVPRLSQDLLETCRTSGFVLCSSDILTSTQPCLPVHHRSPTFAKSPCDTIECPKSPVFSETSQGDDCKMELSPEHGNSPVFGRNPQHDGSSSACKPHILICANSGIINSSQESVTASVTFVSCQPESAELLRSPALPRNLRSLERSTSPVSETHQGQTEQSHGCSTSPVFGTMGQQHESQLENTSCVVPSAAELRGSDIKGSSPGVVGPPQSLRPDDKTEWSEGGRPKTTTSSQSDDAQELIESPKKWNSPTAERTSNITLLSSDEDNSVTPVGSPSPVFPEERPVQQADVQGAALNHVASPGTPESSSSHLSTTERDPQPASSEGVASRVIAQATEPTGGQMVHYYWGVPFCPRGLDPDSYTQVILAQLEVYEKSLKQAQRCLLRKAEWGEAILPQPQKSPSPESASESPQPHVLRRLRRRGKKQSEAADSSPAEAEEDEDKEQEEEGEREKNKEEKNERGEGEGGQVEADDFDVCPETQLSDNDSMQDLQVDTDDGAKLRSESPERPEVEIILQDSPAGDELREEEEEMEVDAPRDGKMEEKIPVCTNVGGQDVRKDTDGGHPDVKEVKDCELRRSVSPELEFGPIPSTPEASVDCPICQGSFPATEIELHAAYCYTEVAVVDERMAELGSLQVSLKPRRTRTRRADVSAEETYTPSNKRQEKCYACQKMVCVKDYGHHTELCIQRQTLKCEAKGNLLSALEQTDQDSEAGPSGFRLQPGDIIDLRDDDDDDDDGGGGEDEEEFRISDSPIRSFTSISEATDCLIDFRKQPRAKKLSRRRR